MRKLKVEEIQKSAESLSTYLRAISDLEKIGVIEALTELNAPSAVQIDGSDTMQAAACEHFIRTGYQLCLTHLLNIEHINVRKADGAVIQPDFMAEESLRRQGITEEELNELRRSL